MTAYLINFTASAKEDIVSIALYTANQWGDRQAIKYAQMLDLCIKKIAQKESISKQIYEIDPSIRISKCQHHYIIYLEDQQKNCITIIAILHKHMDLMQRLKKRLDL